MTLWKWSQTASVNGNADSTCPFPEGMAPSALNDGTRGMMAAVAKWRDDISGVLVTGGTSAAYTLSTNQILQNPPTDGQMIAFTPHVTNTGSQITVDGSLATIQTQIGALVLPGTLIASTPYRAKYNAAANAWVLEGFYGNPYNIPLLGGIDYWGTTAPNSSFVFPVGQALSRTVYAATFAIVGTTFGAGDGSTTFNLPDKRGRVSAGVDNMGGSSGGQMPGYNLGTKGGAASQAISMGNLPASPAPVTAATSGYTPGVSGQPANGIPNGAGQNQLAGGASGSTYFPGPLFGAISGFSSLAVGSNTANLGSGTPLSTLPPTIACNYIMRVI
jgi:microcystin-dependent protein